MTDLAKRKTLKTIAATAATGVAASLAGGALAAAPDAEQAMANDRPAELATIDVSTRISPTRNDLEVVLTNRGTDAVTITGMTPHKTVVPRGEFNFAALLQDGPLRLSAGESAVVPLQHGEVSALSVVPMAGHSLTDTLRKSLSIVTEGTSFASVTVHEMTALA